MVLPKCNRFLKLLALSNSSTPGKSLVMFFVYVIPFNKYFINSNIGSSGVN